MMAIEVLSPSNNRLLAIGASVPISETGLVHIWGRNDSLITQALGIVWTVKDPDGAVVEEYADWSYGHGPGDDHEFIGERFNLAKEGTYTLEVNLVMNKADPVTVDSYQGALCTVTLEIPPEYELLEETIYPYAYIYDGDDETAIFTFTTDPFTPADWIAGRLSSHVEDEVRKNGGRVMEMRVYVDKTPLLWSNWRIEVRGVPPAGVAASVGIVWWGVAILAALVIALIIVITWAVKTIVSTFKRNPALAEVKPGWGKETLILTIHDSEEYWERPATPAETLEGMSEEELRDYLDQIAEEEVPPVVSWWPIAILGGLVILGGGAVALVVSRKG